jgi:hypothetical protein
MKQVIIDRQRWGTQRLRMHHLDKQCCLGFVCEAYSVPVRDLINISMPGFLSHANRAKLPKWLTWLLPNKGDVHQVVDINDSSRFSWSEKEKMLKPIFKKHRIELVFKGKRQ